MKLISISKEKIVYLYYFIPVCIVIVLVDQYFLNEILKLNYLSIAPEEYAYWVVFFNLPHIVSSMLTLADRDYIDSYKWRFFKPFILIVAVTIFFGLIIFHAEKGYYFYGVIVVAYAFFTTRHVLLQQYGILMKIMKRKPRFFDVNKNISIFISILLYLMLFFDGLEGFHPLINGVVVVGLFFSFIFLILMMREDRGSWVVFLNLLLVGGSYYFYSFGYIFFFLALPRLIHDISAFFIYINHEENRQVLGYKNFLYGFLYKRFPIFFIVPFYAVLIAFIINEIPLIYLFFITLVLDFFHYYLESKIWSREGYHGKYISIT